MSQSFFKYFCLIIFVIIFYSNARAQENSTLPSDSIKNSKVFSHSFEKIWTASLEIVSEKGWPIQTIDKGSGIIVTDFITFDLSEIPLNFHVPNGTGMLFLLGHDFRINIFIINISDNKTNVRINFYPKEIKNFPTIAKRITSQGKLEIEFFNMIEKKCAASSEK